MSFENTKLTLVDPKTGVKGKEIHINPRRVVELTQENLVKDTEDPPRLVTHILYASGAKRTVEGSMLEVARTLDRGAR